MSDFRMRMELGTTPSGEAVSLTREFHRALTSLAGGIGATAQAQVADAAGVILTASAQGTLSAVSVHNTTGGAITLEVWLDTHGTAGAVASTKIHNASLAAGATVSPGEGQRLLSGGKVYMKASTAGALTATITFKG